MIDREAWGMGHVGVPFAPGVADDIRIRQQRDVYRELGRECGAVVVLIHLAVLEAELRRRLAARRGRDPEADLLAGYLSGFEAPGPDETDVTVVPFPDR